MFSEVAKKIIRKVNKLGSKPLPTAVQEAIVQVLLQNLTLLVTKIS